MRKLLLTFLFISAVLFSSSAESISFPVSSFDGLSVGDCFNVSLEKGMSYSLVADIPEEYSQLIRCKVENSILKLSFDQKKMSKEMKEIKIEPPINVTITIPDAISSIKIEGKSMISVPDGTLEGDNISISATDQSKITSFSANDSGNLSVILSKRAEAVMSTSVKSLKITASNNSSLEIQQNSTETTIDISGSASVVASGSTSVLKIFSKGSSKSIINGEAQEVSFDCSSTSSTNASNLQSNSSVVMMSGLCTLSVGISKSLSLSLNSGASLEFYGDPAIKIDEIKLSTVKHIEQEQTN